MSAASRARSTALKARRQACSASIAFGFAITLRKCSMRTRESTQTVLSGAAAARSNSTFREPFP